MGALRDACWTAFELSSSWEVFDPVAQGAVPDHHISAHILKAKCLGSELFGSGDGSQNMPLFPFALSLATRQQFLQLIMYSCLSGIASKRNKNRTTDSVHNLQPERYCPDILAVTCSAPARSSTSPHHRGGHVAWPPEYKLRKRGALG